MNKREIKFRAWDEKNKEWLCTDEDEQECFAVQNSKAFVSGQAEREGWLKLVDDVDIMQFTGLLDRNGKEIYEGDICKMKFGGIGDEFIISIRWDFSGANWKFDDHTSFDDGVGLGNWDFKCGIANDSEVIGNIYENPDLLT